ncbi:MAG: selenide, water dikinase SelD [Pseudomonadota bacterium]
MESQASPPQHDLVLLGGGHSHALLLRRWAMNPVPGVRITLVSESHLSPYSGMLPGLVAGHYRHDEVHIDLRRLCRVAGARFVRGRSQSLDLKRRLIHLSGADGRPSLGYDWLSINTGATPMAGGPGVAEHTTPVKPIAGFYPQWKNLEARALKSGRGLDIAVVGGGAGGAELCLAVAHALRHSSSRLHWVYAQGEPLNGFPARLRRRVIEQCRAYGIECHGHFSVTEATGSALIGREGQRLECDSVLWCTGVVAPGWPGESGLSVTDEGFIRVDATLRSLSHREVFAVGDIAHFEPRPLAKAGVYAVRAADTLYDNLRRQLAGQSLKPFRPQRRFLSLLALGGQKACGSRNGFAFSGRWVWRWKDHIDRRFMQQFVPEVRPPKDGETTMHCGGCGGKVGSGVLHRSLHALNLDSSNRHSQVEVGVGDDAAVLSWRDDSTGPEASLLAQSVDGFRDFLDDPYTLGQIASEHALSDLFAMSAQPHSAQVMATLSYAAEPLIERDLGQLMAGVQSVLQSHDCPLVGGHSDQGAELRLGLVVNGTLRREALALKTHPVAGHQLVLCKPLGSGVLFAADRLGAARGDWVEAAIAVQRQSNRRAADIARTYRASALTDITGFGLVGHLLEMLRSKVLCAHLDLASLPVMDGARGLFARGFESSLQKQNLAASRAIAGQWQEHPLWPLLFDPQTSGGLLMCLPPDMAGAGLKALNDNGYTHARRIGYLTELSGDERADERIHLYDSTADERG